ncbi:MAG: sensor histidine kinase, partial [Lewinellaceae bacterium]|nr:sensor histidine kinase [Lewinellaceae bacterium]
SDTHELAMHELIKKKLDQLEPLISAKNLDIHTNLAEVSMAMDPTLAEVLLNNLLVNAIKHNFSDGRIDISLRKGKLLIRNTGKPLDSSPETLFERFRKGADASPSLGLGLAIVKEICNIYGFKAQYDFQDGWHELSVTWTS